MPVWLSRLRRGVYVQGACVPLCSPDGFVWLCSPEGFVWLCMGGRPCVPKASLVGSAGCHVAGASHSSPARIPGVWSFIAEANAPCCRCCCFPFFALLFLFPNGVDECGSQGTVCCPFVATRPLPLITDLYLNPHTVTAFLSWLCVWCL